MQLSGLGSIMIFLYQNFEWTIVTYIIKTQMNRSIGEITFDHFHEKMTEAIDKNDKNSYRR